MAERFNLPKAEAPSTKGLILKTYGLEAVKTLQYGAGVSVAIARSQAKSSANPYVQMAQVSKDPVLYKSALGTPVFCNFEIQGGQWTDQNDVIHQWPDLVFDTVLITVNQQKNIVKTVIQGRNGSVKEYISDGDYMVNIKMILTESNGIMPLQQMSDLKKALDAPMALSVVSRFLQNLDIDNLVVDSYSMPQDPGSYSQQGVEINFLSDEPIELII